MLKYDISLDLESSAKRGEDFEYETLSSEKIEAFQALYKSLWKGMKKTFQMEERLPSIWMPKKQSISSFGVMLEEHFIERWKSWKR